MAWVSCQKEPVSATDPLPFPMDANKDLSVSPGDDFFAYCNGGWLKANPVALERSFGGVLFDGETSIARREKELRESDPYVASFFRMLDQMHAHPEASEAFLEQKIAAIPKPASYEEAFRTVGRLLKEGVNTLAEIKISNVDGKVVLALLPILSKDYSLHARSGSQALDWILDELGVAPENVIMYSQLGPLFEALKGLSLDQLYAVMQDGQRKMFQAYVRDEGLSEHARETVRREGRLLFNYPISYHLAQKYVPESKKQEWMGKVMEVKNAFRNRLLNADWLSETTRLYAVEKLDAMQCFVATPDQWYLDCIPDIEPCSTFVEMAYLLQSAKNKISLKLVGGTDFFTRMMLDSMQTANNEEVPADLTMCNAYYLPQANFYVIYPALLLPPILSEDVSAARQYALFCCVGHEITHGFDNSGSKFDKYGNKHNWWTVADVMSFEDRCKALVNCYDHLVIDPDLYPDAYGNGTRTLGENIADLGGFLAALDAYKAYLERNGYFGEVYKAQLRRFYEGFADIWCVRYNQEKWNLLLNTDVHSPARHRVNGVVMNTDLWYELYNVTRDNKLYLPPERRSYIW